jgi:hypothetical protein
VDEAPPFTPWPEPCPEDEGLPDDDCPLIIKREGDMNMKRVVWASKDGGFGGECGGMAHWMMTGKEILYSPTWNEFLLYRARSLFERDKRFCSDSISQACHGPVTRKDRAKLTLRRI